MSTLQEFLIKSAGMEKVALNALSRRIMAMRSPKFVTRRYGKKRAARYLKDVATATDNFKDIDRKHSTLPAMFRAATKDPETKEIIWNSRKQLAPTLEARYGIVPRDTLVKRIKEVIPDYNTSKLTHQNYIIGDIAHLNDKDMLLASTSLPYIDPMHLPVQEAVLRDIQKHNRVLGEVKKDFGKSPRSIQKALALTEGQNILEPGTYANRLFNRIYARPTLREKLFLPDKPRLRQYEQAQNAMYYPFSNTIAVSPKYGKHYDVVEAHEKGHFKSYNDPADVHAAHAYSTLRRMKAVANKNKFNLPLQDAQLMQEVLAESYIPKILGKHVTSPRASYLDNAIADIYMLPSVLQNRKNFFQKSRNKYAIDNMKGTEADKELFRQLALNYGHNLL